MEHRAETKGQEEGQEEKVWTLDKETELRVEVDLSPVTVTLLSGTCESFGTELKVDQPYVFTDCKIAFFTWHGCHIRILGAPGVMYPASDTPMTSYIHAHTAIDKLRVTAKQKDINGPRTMVVGPTDSGKSSLVRVLLNYAVRAGWEPTCIDLDVGQNALSIPGSIAASPVKFPISPEDPGITVPAPLVFYYGHAMPNRNLKLYRSYVERLAKSVERRSAEDKLSKYAGAIIDTCGWVDDLQGYELVIEIANAFKVDIILVMNHERMFSALAADKRLKTTTVAKVAKSGGVVTRNSADRFRARNHRIRQYFYRGVDRSPPQQKVTIELADINLYTLEGQQDAQGQERMVSPLRASSDLVHTILGVSYAQNAESVSEENIAGFLFVTGVDEEAGTMSCITPCPGRLPHNALVAGSIKWFDAS